MFSLAAVMSETKIAAATHKINSFYLFI